MHTSGFKTKIHKHQTSSSLWVSCSANFLRVRWFHWNSEPNLSAFHPSMGNTGFGATTNDLLDEFTERGVDREVAVNLFAGFLRFIVLTLLDNLGIVHCSDLGSWSNSLTLSRENSTRSRVEKNNSTDRSRQEAQNSQLQAQSLFNEFRTVSWRDLSNFDRISKFHSRWSKISITKTEISNTISVARLELGRQVVERQYLPSPLLFELSKSLSPVEARASRNLAQELSSKSKTEQWN